eukprot:s910_g16.t1
MGKKRQYEDGGGPGPVSAASRPRPGILDDEDIPRPKKVKPANLEKLSLEELHQRKHDLKQEENYQNMVMSKKKRGPYSASDIRATYTQVLRFQYLQKEARSALQMRKRNLAVDLEIERRDARKEKQAEQKAFKRAQAEEAQRARRAALMAAEQGFEGDMPGVALPPEAGYGYGGGGSSQFQDFHSMGSFASSAGGSMASSEPSSSMGSFFAGAPSGSASSSSHSMAPQGPGFFNADAASSAAGGAGAGAPMNPMLMMAQMMLETQKKLQEAQEKMMKVQDLHK